MIPIVVSILLYEILDLFRILILPISVLKLGCIQETGGEMVSQLKFQP